MLTLILSMAFLGQDDYVKGYQPRAGDRLLLSETSENPVPVITSLVRAPDLARAIQAKDSKTRDAMTARGDIASVAAGTPVVYVKRHPARTEGGDDLSEVRVVEGPLKDKVVFCQTSAVKKKAEVAAKGKPDKKPKREPLNEDQVADDIRAAIKKAKLDTSRLPSLEQKKFKEKMMKAAIETVCKKNKATLEEINAIATRARIFVNFDGMQYDMTGKRVK